MARVWFQMCTWADDEQVKFLCCKCQGQWGCTLNGGTDLEDESQVRRYWPVQPAVLRNDRKSLMVKTERKVKKRTDFL